MTDCTVTWTVDQPDPRTGVMAPHTMGFGGDCAEAQALGAEYGVPVTQVTNPMVSDAGSLGS